jgi:hypothetical protein
VNGRRCRRIALAVVIVCIASGAAFAQRFGGRSRSQRSDLGVEVQGNTPYDGRFTFVRIRYNAGFGRFGNWLGNGGIPWSHDYPEGEVHFAKILEDISFLRVRDDGSNILSLTDPELFNYPVAYMAEPGFWAVTPDEAKAFRAYLLKGGFVIFDDFRGWDWDNLQEQMRIVLPELRWIELDGRSRVFHSFFEIDHPETLVPPYGGEPASYWGLYEENNPNKRLLAIANVNNDISEYWEVSDRGVYIVDLSNDAYKFGVNYVMYGLTH